MNTRKLRVLVTDGDTRAALAVTRSLGRRGHDVLVGEKRTPSLAHTSRYCTERIVYPDPVVSSAEFIDSLEKVVRECEVDLLIPAAEITTYLVASARSRFEPACAVPFAPVDAFSRAANKVDVITTAHRIGVPVPRHVVLSSLSDLRDVDLGFPLVIKPGQSRVRTPGGWISTSVSYSASPEALRRDLASRAPHEYPLMLQERIVGAGMGVFAYYHEGRPIALFSHRRLRERPPSGGVSVLSESAPLAPVAQAYATRLLDELRWHGVAMVEFKHDDRENVPKLMEINGRLWGSLQLAIDAGVDFPALIAQGVNGSFEPQVPYRLGVRNRWFWGDVDSLLLRVVGGVTAPHRRAQGRLGAILEFLKLWGPNLYYDNPKADDFRPFAWESYQWLRRAMRLPPAGAAAKTPAGAMSAPLVPLKSMPGARPTRGRDLQVRWSSSIDGAGLGEQAWNALAAGSATNSIFQTHQWARAWCNTLGHGRESLFVTAADASGTVGVAPLTVERGPARERVLRFVGDGRSDYCDLLAPAGDPAPAAAMLQALLASDRWDVIDLSNVPSQSQTVNVVRSLCARARLPFILEDQYVCPTLLIEGHERHAMEIMNKPSLRRPVNYFKRTGRFVCRDLTTAAEVEPLLETFFAQHVARWEGTGSLSLFVSPANRAFYRELTRTLAAADWLLFTSVELDDRPIAFHFGFDYQGAMTWYKPCFDVAYASKSPGLALVSHLIRRAIETKRRELDFTVGDEAFKRRFTTAMRKTVHIQIFRDTTRYLLAQSRRKVIAAVKKVTAPAQSL